MLLRPIFLIIHKTKLPRDHVSESGDSRSDTCIVTPPPVSGLTHNKTLHPASHPQGKLLTQLYSNVYPLCIPSFPFPTLVPQIFIFSFEVKKSSRFLQIISKEHKFQLYFHPLYQGGRVGCSQLPYLFPSAGRGPLTMS